MSNFIIQCKSDLSMPQTYPGGDRNLWKGCQLFDALKGVGEISGVAASAGVEAPVHCPLCPAVTSCLGIWVLGESTGL